MAQIPNTGAFVSTTSTWDVQELYAITIDPDLRDVLVRLYQNLNLMAININQREIGLYATSEVITGNKYFSNPNETSASIPYRIPTLRNEFGLVVNFGSLPNAGTKSVPHNLSPNDGWNFTDLYATATDTTSFLGIKIPYASPVALNNNIELNIDATNVNITTGIDRSNFDICYVVIKYFKF